MNRKAWSHLFPEARTCLQDCNCPFLTVDAKSAREEGFLHPTCPRRVRTGTSVIHHHAISTCQFDNDFSPGVSKLEMLFRLWKQLHVFCFLSQRRAARMQMKGIENLPGLWPQHTPQPSTPRENAHRWRENLCLGKQRTVRCCDHCNLCSLRYRWFKSLPAGPCSLQKAIFFGLCIGHRLFSSFHFSSLPPIPWSEASVSLSPATVWIKGETRTNLASATMLRIQCKTCRPMLAEICRRADLFRTCSSGLAHISR